MPKNNFSSGVPFIKIPSAKIRNTYFTLLFCRGKQLNDLAGQANLGLKKFKKIVEEFQLYALNDPYRNTDIPMYRDIENHYPTIYQFIKDNKWNLEPIYKSILVLPTSNKVKANLVIRTLFHYKGESSIDIAKNLNLDKNFVMKLKRDLFTIVNSKDEKKLKEFGEKCGLIQCREYRGGINQYLKYVYFLLHNPDINKGFYEFNKRTVKTYLLNDPAIFVLINELQKAQLEIFNLINEKENLCKEEDPELFKSIEKAFLDRKETVNLCKEKIRKFAECPREDILDSLGF